MEEAKNIPPESQTTENPIMPVEPSSSMNRWLMIAAVIGMVIVTFFIISNKQPVTPTPAPQSQTELPSPTETVIVIEEQQQVEDIDVGDINEDIADIQTDVNQL